MWTARIEKETLTVLQELAASLGFVATAPGKYQGAPAPADFLDALAAAYRANPDVVFLSLRGALFFAPQDDDAGEGGLGGDDLTILSDR